MQNPKEVIGFALITAGLGAAWYARPDVDSPWLWAGLATAALGVFLVSRAARGRKPEPMAGHRHDPLDGLEIPDHSSHHHHDIGPDDFN